MEPLIDPEIAKAFRPRESSLRGLRNTVLVRLLVVALLPLVILSWYFRQRYTNELENNARTVLQTLVKGHAEAIDRFISNKITMAKSLASNDLVPLPTTENQISGLLRFLQEIDPAVFDLGVFDGLGNQVQYAGPFDFLEGKNYAKEPWFVALATGGQDAYVSDVYRGYRDQPHFIVAVRTVKEGIPWILRITIHPTRFSELVNNVHAVAGAHAYIVNREGIIQSAPESVGQMLTTAPFVPGTDENEGVRETRDPGQRFIVSTARLTTVPWTLVVRQDAEVAYFSVGTTQRIVLIIFLVGALFIVVISVYATQGLVRRYNRAERDRAKLMDQLVQTGKLSTLGEMAAGVAHEINNPLAVILSEIGILEDEIDPRYGTGLKQETVSSKLDSIKDEVRRCKTITHKLLGFARFHKTKLTSCNLTDVSQEAIDLVRKELNLENIEIILEPAGKPPVTITDGEKIKQVLINLMRNAADAIVKDGRIALATFAERDTVSVIVTDTGPGISDENLSKLFIPFFTTKEVGKGTGLGLSISHGIVTSLGGRINVVSKIGEGTTFEIVLPKRTR